MEILVLLMVIGMCFGVVGIVGMLLGFVFGSHQMVEKSFLLSSVTVLMGTPLVLTMTVKAILLMLFGIEV